MTGNENEDEDEDEHEQMTEKLQWLLGEARDERGKRKWTVARIAEEVGSGRCHLTQVLSNTPGRGGYTRRRLARFFAREYPRTWREILGELGWAEEMENEEGRMKNEPEPEPAKAGTPYLGGASVPGGTFHVERNERGSGEREKR